MAELLQYTLGARVVIAACAGLVAMHGTSLAYGQDTEVEAARADIMATYNFDPSHLSFDEQAQRAPALGALWARYDKSPVVYRDALRSALRSDGSPELLYCDGGMLLLNKSREPADLDLGLQAISRCSLSEMQQTPYFYTMHALAVRGVDTLDLQFRILSKPKYSAFIVAHALTLGQGYAFLYPLLVQDETRYVTRLVDRLAIEDDATAQKSLLMAIWYAATAEADLALKGMAQSDSRSETIREEARRLLALTDQARNWEANDPILEHLRELLDLKGAAPAADLRLKRRARMRAISDEALMELDAYTALLYREMKR